MNFIYCLLYFY